MTTKDFAEKLDSQLKKISDAKFLLTCVSDTHAKQVKRIFNDGKNGNNGMIGQYSTKPMLASKEQFLVKSKFRQSYIDTDTKSVVDRPTQEDVKFWLKFKNKKTGVVNKKATPIMYISGGYREFRKIQGKQSNFVNLRYTENLKFDFTNSLLLSGDSYITGTKRKENSDKVGWLSDKYGKSTFKLSKSEKEQFRQCVINKLNAVFSN